MGDFDTSVDLKSDLVAHYPFSGHVRDISGNGNHGKVHGDPIITTDRHDNEKSALLFDGEDDYIELTNESAFDLKNFTISIVFEWPGFFSDCWIISKGTHSENFSVMINGDTRPGYASYVHQTNRGSWSLIASRRPMPKDEFIHLVITVSEDHFCSYINGQIQHERTGISPPLLNDAPVILTAGGYYKISHFSFVTLDDLQIYNRAMSAEEVRRLYIDLFLDEK